MTGFALFSSKMMCWHHDCLQRKKCYLRVSYGFFSWCLDPSNMSVSWPGAQRKLKERVEMVLLKTNDGRRQSGAVVRKQEKK